MWTNEHAPRPHIKPRLTHYCPQCGDRYYGDLRCARCRVPTLPLEREEKRAA